ncbi:MAG: cadmium-translocating P-type ATPase [Candidatus Cloacimonas sp. 4484_209]|nr:MAG: cadmium-translocating P-type ATPase [Candidatus Cloacimonas sp. 4484_209]
MMTSVIKRNILEISISIIVFILAFIMRSHITLRMLLYILSYLIAGRGVIFSALKNIRYGKFFDENLLMTVATLGAFAIKAYPEAVAVMLFFRVGELLENVAVNRSKRSIRFLLSIKAEYANLITDGNTIEKVVPGDVNIGDRILVKPGEKVPLDGVITEGESIVDTSVLTGESIPRYLKKEDTILSGMLNRTGLLTVSVTKVLRDSTVSQILRMVENASQKKSATERFITKFSKYYTPSIVILAVLIATLPVILYRLPFLTQFFVHQETFSEWVYRALVFLVIACPCALVISIPLGFFGGVGGASRCGILVRGADFLEAMTAIETIAYDKTGTLTEGNFKVTNIVPLGGFSKEKILELVARIEMYSNHPIARAILELRSGKVYTERIEEYTEIPGHGLRGKIDGQIILVGNDKLLHKENIKHKTCKTDETVVHIAVDNEYAGYIVVEDEIKPGARTTIEKLRNGGINQQIMLTGDSERIAKAVSEKLGLDGFYAELLPQEKVDKIEELVNTKVNKSKKVAFVGDGINDAPVLARSDIGIAMGALGSDAAIESADIVLMTDELAKIYEAILIAKKTKKVVWQNIILAIGIKMFFLTLGVLGMATMWEAVFADVGVAILAILNSSRTIYFPLR